MLPHIKLHLKYLWKIPMHESKMTVLKKVDVI